MKYQTISIRKKILIPIISVSLIAVLLTIFVTLYLIDRQLDYTVGKELENARHVIVEEFGEQEHNLMPETRLLASDPSIKEAAINRDSEFLAKKLTPTKVTFNTDGIRLLDTRGGEIARVGEPVPTEKTIIKAGFNLEHVCLFTRSDNGLWMTTVAPVRSQNGSLIALILAGNKIDRSLLERIKKKTGAEVVVEHNNLFVGSSDSAMDTAIKYSYKEEGFSGLTKFLIDWSPLHNVPYAIDRIEIKTTGGNRATVYILTSTLQSSQAKKNNTTAILFIDLTALFILLAAAYILSRNITKPLEIMSKRARMIADGNYKQRIEYTDIKEIDELAASFNIMSEALEEKRQQLEERAYTDGLTGLYNHRYFQENLISEVTRAERYKHELSLIIIDIDDFKKVNDRFGHSKGDAALKVLADSIRESIRDIDVACRIGGEEFAIILPETGPYEAYTVAERLRLDVSSQPIESIGGITISLGIATYPDHASENVGLIEAADNAMYHAKRQGKNLTLIYGGKVLEAPEMDKWLIEEAYYIDTLSALALAVDAKDVHPHKHSERVSTLVDAIARELGLPSSEIEHARIAGLLHDIGKISIPDSILKKPDMLTEAEFEQIKRHPIISEQLLRVTKLDSVLKAVLLHHERLDGSGYPYGISGEHIPLLARIIAVADTFDVLISDRHYRDALTTDEAIARLKQYGGTKLDAEVIDALTKAIEQDATVRAIINGHDSPTDTMSA